MPDLADQKLVGSWSELGTAQYQLVKFITVTICFEIVSILVQCPTIEIKIRFILFLMYTSFFSYSLPWSGDFLSYLSFSVFVVCSLLVFPHKRCDQ